MTFQVTQYCLYAVEKVLYYWQTNGPIISLCFSINFLKNWCKFSHLTVRIDILNNNVKGVNGRLFCFNQYRKYNTCASVFVLFSAV